MVRHVIGAAAAAMLAMLAGCGPNYSPNTYNAAAVQQANKVTQGDVVGVREVRVSADATLGTVTGAAVGGIAGSQVDSGGPITALSTLGGTVIGGLVGNGVEHAGGDTTAWEYIVRQNDGSLVSVTQRDKVPLALGEKVLVIAGKQARVVPDYTVALPGMPPPKPKQAATAKPPATPATGTTTPAPATAGTATSASAATMSAASAPPVATMSGTSAPTVASTPSAPPAATPPPGSGPAAIAPPPATAGGTPTAAAASAPPGAAVSAPLVAGAAATTSSVLPLAAAAPAVPTPGATSPSSAPASPPAGVSTTGLTGTVPLPMISTRPGGSAARHARRVRGGR